MSSAKTENQLCSTYYLGKTIVYSMVFSIPHENISIVSTLSSHAHPQLLSLPPYYVTDRSIELETEGGWDIFVNLIEVS